MSRLKAVAGARGRERDVEHQAAVGGRGDPDVAAVEPDVHARAGAERRALEVAPVGEAGVGARARAHAGELRRARAAAVGADEQPGGERRARGSAGRARPPGARRRASTRAAERELDAGRLGSAWPEQRARAARRRGRQRAQHRVASRSRRSRARAASPRAGGLRTNQPAGVHTRGRPRTAPAASSSLAARRAGERGTALDWMKCPQTRL